MTNRDDYYRRNAPLTAYMNQAQQQRDQYTRQIPAQPAPSYTPSRNETQWQYPPAAPYSYEPPRESKWRIFLYYILPSFMIGAALATVAMVGLNHPVNHPATMTLQPVNGNTLVCQHYKTQRAWVKGLAEPTLTDAVKFETWVAVDAGQSTGTLHTNLAAMSADEQHNKSSYAASEKVVASCQALGVQF